MLSEEYSKDLDIRDKVQLENAFLNAKNIVSKNYLKNLEPLKIVEIQSDIKNIDIARVSRFFRLEKLVYDKEENKLDKLSNVLNAVSFAKGNIAVVINSDGKNIEYFFGVVNKNQNLNLTSQYETLQGTFNGSFQGSKLEMLKNSELRNLIDDIFDDTEGKKIISSMSGIASLNVVNEENIEGFIQGLEKLTDAMSEKSYSIILIADSISNEIIENIKLGYENLYSQMYPFLKTDITLNESDTVSLTEGITKGLTKTINESITYTQGKSRGVGKIYAINKGIGISSSIGIGGEIGGGIGISKNSGTSQGKNLIESKSFGESNQNGFSESKSSQESTSNTDSNTVGKSIQISCENKSVKSILEKIDNQIERIRECENFGCFSVGAYVISNDNSVNNSVASIYNALMRGENSAVESSVINTWTNENSIKKIEEYLRKLRHPIFEFNLENDNFTSVTPASLVNSKELAIHLMLPKKSVQGIPVVNSTSFGRNIFKLSKHKEELKDLELGKIYHMGNVEKDKVNLSKKSLAMHTFVTGSTGAGKSNTIYQMLDELDKNDVNFLVIEPAKGEYKNIFGFRDDVTVLGTNSRYTKLLKINPFKFANNIHVLEHIDKLVEIFNACWPMYAAMPAVLKDSIERAYKVSGWDLLTSENKYNNSLYPTFTDVLEQLNEVINTSAFSEELKGNYIGALSTRIKSLTNGINGQIFCGTEINNEILFDSNVIVDLSRIGSMETKSMIMGILIMRLQEHRMTQGGMNKELRHVTVLEEAHNILKRTSTEQISEGSNLLGKSIEMLSNSIAEMRTYGEGFIIVDQSPNMLDMSVIRNTNTKIILRLPEQSDRELVGKSIGLNENQISELAKLETGIATVYQNDWLEPVLCKINHYKETEYNFVEKEIVSDSNELKLDITKYLVKKYNSEKITEDIDILKERILISNYSTKIKLEILNCLDLDKDKNIELEDFSSIIKNFYYNETLLKKASKANNIEEWNKIILKNIDECIGKFKEIDKNIILQCLLREFAIYNQEFEKFYFGWTEYMRGKVR